MKNIHVLPSRIPSGIHFYDYHITNDEEIKMGDWYIIEFNGTTITKCTSEEELISIEGRNDCQKIILTTDQNLIKNGVQKIDDEFLEWFVNNSNCEEVEVEKSPYDGTKGIDKYWGGEYQIIIPKEEPKQETLINDTDSHSLGFENFEVIKTEEDAKIFVEALEKITEPNEKLKKAFREYEKQETLEEVPSKFELIGPDMDEILDAINFINENYKEVKLKPMDWSLLVSDNYSIFVKFEPEGDENKHIRYMNDLLSENDFECKL